jgi:hypothetical protein
VKKKILLVSSSFFPEISPRSYRATELAKEFSRQGHRVVVISKHRNYNYQEIIDQYPMTIKMFRKPVLPQITDLDLKPFSTILRYFSRLLSLLFEYPEIVQAFKVKEALKNEGGYDLMISFAVPYPVHWGVAWSRKKNHGIAVTWIADCGDPFMGNILDTFRKPFYFKYFEKYFCRKADFISIPIEGAKSGYYKEFHYKIRIIPQGFEFNVVKQQEDRPSNDVPTFAYAGSFLKGIRDPEPLMNSLIRLNRTFKFLVFTNNMSLLEGYKSKLGEKLLLSDYIPRTDLIKILSKADFLINFDNNTALNSPSKLIDYAIAGRPVLNITKDFREEVLMSFLDKDYSQRMILNDVIQYHIGNVTRQFLEVCKK